MNKERKDTNHFAEFLVGIVMMVAGLVILLMNIQISSFGFFHFGRISSAPILVIAFIVLLIWAVVRGRNLQWILVAADVLCIIVSVILGTSFYFHTMSAFSLLVMLMLFAVGAGLVLKNLSFLKK